VKAEAFEKYAFGIWTAIISVLMLGPLVIMVAISITANGYISMPDSGVSLRWYADMLGRSEFLEAAGNSLLLAFESTLSAVVLGTLASLAIARYQFPGRGLIVLLGAAPLFVPLVMTGLAILIFFSSTGIGGPALRLFVAHVCLTIPYIMRMVAIALAGFQWNQELAARNLGASAPRAFVEVVLPQILPGIIAGAAFAFIVSFDDVGVSIFLTGASYKTLPVELYAFASFNLTPMIAAVSVTMIIFSAIFVLVIERLFGVQKVLGAEAGSDQSRPLAPAEA
jgi:putative spermidine/putrescine transport system permease protein